MLASLLDPDHAHPKNDGCDCQQQGALSLDGSRRREVVGELTSLGWCMPGAAHSEGRQPCGKPAASPFPPTMQEVWEQTSSGGVEPALGPASATVEASSHAHLLSAPSWPWPFCS